MSNTNPNQNSQYFNDERFNFVETNGIEANKFVRLAREVDASIAAQYIFQGRIAYSKADAKLMYCTGTAWVLVGNGTVTLINTGTGLTGGPITTTGTISIANTTVTAGTYELTNLTVNAQGQLTAAATGAVQHDASMTGAGTVSSPLQLTNQAITPAAYQDPAITVNIDGIITAIAESTVVTDNSADWTQASQVMGAGDTDFLANNLFGGYPNQIPAELNTATGVFTASRAGWYTLFFSADWTAVDDIGLIDSYAYITRTGGAVIASTTLDNQGQGKRFSVSIATTMNGTTDTVVFGVHNAGVNPFTLQNGHASIVWQGR